MAIHDATYANRPASWIDLHWRMQYLAEMRVGTRVRREARADDEAVAAAKEAME